MSGASPIAEVENRPRIGVVVVAAGQSRRFGGPTKKVFCPLAGRPVFLHALHTFRAVAAVGPMVLVLSAEDVDSVRTQHGAELARLGVGPLVVGGAERFDSVAAGLTAIVEADPSVALLAVHDAARPLVSAATVSAVAAAAAECGAALAAEPATSTVKRAGPDGCVAATLPRAEIWLAQTPQIARRELLLAAYAARGEGRPPTDDVELIERLGLCPVKLIAADGPNLKITTAADLRFAEAWLARAAESPVTTIVQELG